MTPTGIPKARRRFRQIAECRYVGQGFELRAEMPDGPLRRNRYVGRVIKSFFDAHKQVYGHAFEDQSCEIITLRVVATVAVEMLKLPKSAHGGRKNPKDAVLYTRRTVFDDGSRRSTRRVTSATSCSPTISSKGPALIVQHNSTTLVPPRWTARRHRAWRHA